jgi:hypothetical protein
LFFSDLTSGPKTGWEGSATQGAAVSVWGKSFGTSRGSSFITVNGVQLTQDPSYAEWGTVGEAAGVAKGTERITFWLNNQCQDGAGTISVTVDGTASNTLPFYVRAGRILFVSRTSGNNSNNGQYASPVGGANGPWQTLPYAGGAIGPGDLLYIRAGTYSEADNYGSVLMLRMSFNGTPNNETTIAGYPAELPVLDANPNGDSGAIRNVYENTGYTTISKLRVLPPSMAIRLNQSTLSHYRLIGLVADGLNKTYPTASTWGGTIDIHDISNIIVYGCIVHDWGRDKYDHALYVGQNNDGWNQSNFDIGWNEVHDLGTEVSGLYIHPKDTDAGQGVTDMVYLHDNVVYNLWHGGIFINSRVRNAWVYNNILYNNGAVNHPGNEYDRPDMSFTVHDITDSNIRFFNNTLYNDRAASGMIIVSGTTNADFKNNIIFSPNVSYFQLVSPTGHITSQNDLYYGAGAPPAWAAIPVNADPLFFNAAAYDFHLQANSPAIGAGVTISGYTTDFDGIFRPQSSNGQFAIGAYEYNVGYVPPPPPGNNPPPQPLTETTPLNSVRAYPNPWRSDRHQGILVTFDNLTSNSTVKLYTLSGHWIRTLDASAGSAGWDLKSDSGDKVASGIYLYVITNNQGQKTRGKLVVIK